MTDAVRTRKRMRRRMRMRTKMSARKMRTRKVVCACARACVCVCVCVYVCYVVFDNIVYDAGIRAWASLRIRDPYNDVGKSRSLIWVPAIVFFYIIFVQPATGIVLHGWAYYLWLGGHYVAGVTLVI